MPGSSGAPPSWQHRNRALGAPRPANEIASCERARQSLYGAARDGGAPVGGSVAWWMQKRRVQPKLRPPIFCNLTADLLDFDLGAGGFDFCLHCIGFFLLH